jgi:hypothetical protein
MKNILCIANGRANEWEALCLDFDLAVQGRSFEEVRQLMNQAVMTYVQDAANESAADRARLLSRRAPLRVRLAVLSRFMFNALVDRKSDRDSTIWRSACPA